MTYDSDTEIIMHYLSRELNLDIPVEESLARLATEFDGAWNLCFIDAQGKFFASRDPYGFHPLCYGFNDDYVVVASESSVLSNLHLEAYDIEPGTFLSIEPTNQTVNITRFAEAKTKAFCFFEYIYFANNASTSDDVNMYETREQIGEHLAHEEQVETNDKDWIVVPVPDTSYVAGSQYATTLQLPFILAIVKNHQVGRTFITGQDRIAKIRMKFSFIKEKLKGKKVILIDDSIVRGSTLKGLVTVLKEWCEVAEVHVRIGCPPLTSPCFYGIDFPTIQELYAGKGSPDPNDFNADSLQYISLNGLMSSIAQDSKKLCTACISSSYPTDVGKIRYNEMLNA